MSFAPHEKELWRRIQGLEGVARTMMVSHFIELLYGDDYVPQELRAGLEDPDHWASTCLRREGFRIDDGLIFTPPRMWKECNYPIDERDVQSAKDLQKFLEEGSILSETFGTILKEMKSKGLNTRLSAVMLDYKMSLAHAAIYNAGYYIKRRGAKNGRQTYWITKQGSTPGTMFDKMVQNDESEFFLREAANRPHQKLARKYFSTR